MKHIFTYAALGLVLLSVRVTTANEVQKPGSLEEAILPHPTGVKPQRDHIWVYALRNGVPTDQITFYFVSNGNKYESFQTDGTGRIDYRLEQAGDPVQILLLDNRYAFRVITTAFGGEAYEARLCSPAPDTGIAVITDKTREIILPGAGKVQTFLTPSGVDGRRTLLQGTKAVFRYPDWAPKYIYPVIDLRRGTTLNIIDGARKYEVVYQQLIPAKFSYLRYKLLRESKPSNPQP